MAPDSRLARNPQDSSLVATLKDWHEEMSPEVRLVFDHSDRYSAIIDLAVEISDDPAGLSEHAARHSDHAARLKQLSSELKRMDQAVDTWHGAGREAFAGSIHRLDSRVDQLAELGSQSSELLQVATQGREAIDHLLSDLVRASIDYAERSLRMARSLAAFTGGAALSEWTLANLRQVSSLLDQLVLAGRRIDGLLTQINQAVDQITESVEQLTVELDSDR